MHTAALITFGHLLVENAATCGHPLHISGAHGALVAETVAVLHAAAHHVGDGLDAAVRMPGESGEIIFGVLVAKIVEQEKRVKILGAPKPERAAQSDAGAFECELGLRDRFNGTNGHRAS